MFGDKKGILLLGSVSITKMIILYNSAAVTGAGLMSCQTLRGKKNKAKVTLLNRVQCDHYCSKLKVNPNVYPELSMFKNMVPGSKICLFFMNIRQENEVEKCESCLWQFLHHVSARTMLINKAGSFVWRIINEHKTWSAIDEVLTRCVHEGRCQNTINTRENIQWMAVV